MTLLSACEAIQPQEEIRPSGSISGSGAQGSSNLITANIGTDTKTYLEWNGDVFKTRWSENDYIFLIEERDDSLVFERCPLVGGAGTSSATFASNLEVDTYLALYATDGNYSDGRLSVILPDSQYHASLGTNGKDNIIDFYYPMVAKSSTTTLDFYNLCSILKFSVVGDGEILYRVSITSNDQSEYLSGRGTVDFGTTVPTMSMDEAVSVAYVNYYVHQVLSDTPVECYVVLPAQVYESGFTIELYTDTGVMSLATGENVVLEQSKIHNVPQIEFAPQYEYTWGLVGEYDWNQDGNTDWDSDITMTKEENFWVLRNQYLEAYSYFKFRCNGSWDVNLGGVIYYDEETGDNNYYPYVNNREWKDLQSYGCDMQVCESGYYDICLDVENAKLYVELISTPEVEYVNCRSYDEITGLMNGTHVEVSGIVVAEYQLGFVLGIEGKTDDCILVYQNSDKSLYDAVIGNYVTVYAEKGVYYSDGQAELTNIVDIRVVDSSEVNPDCRPWYEISDAQSLYDFHDFYMGYCRYVKVRGYLTAGDSNRYYIKVPGCEDLPVVVLRPLSDLSAYVGSDVVMEGFFIGMSGDGTLTFVLSKLNVVVSFVGSIEGAEIK